MDLNLPEDFGIVNVRAHDGTCVQLDLLEMNERLASISRIGEDKPSWEFLWQVQALLQEKGLPSVSCDLANYFVQEIGKLMAELKKKRTAEPMPALPASMASAYSPCPTR